MTPIKVRSAVVPIGDVKPYPMNPRRGNVGKIQESLQINGQYRPIVVQQETNYILAGNHTWKAAKNLGWKEIAVTFIECTDKVAKKIVLTDNRTSDLAMYNDDVLLELLDELDSLVGTGFSDSDLDKIDGLFEAPLSTPSIKDEETEKPELTSSTETSPNLIRIGVYVLEVDDEELDTLGRRLKDQAKGKKEQVEVLRQMLGLEERAPKENAVESHPVVMGSTEVVPINEVISHPRNPREGDIGAISESLKIFGQYRPIVADKATRYILVGNHTWQAAQALEWTEIAVTWVEVDEEQAVKILLADNKTADLATYDDEELQILLASLGDFVGTGFDDEDIDSILRGNMSEPLPKTVKVKVGTWTFKVSRSEFQVWQDSLPLSHDEACGVIAERLRLTNWMVRKAEK